VETSQKMIIKIDYLVNDIVYLTMVIQLKIFVGRTIN